MILSSPWSLTYTLVELKSIFWKFLQLLCFRYGLSILVCQIIPLHHFFNHMRSLRVSYREKRILSVSQISTIIRGGSRAAATSKMERWKPSYHIFLKTPLPRYWLRHNLYSPQKLFFQTRLNYISLGCCLRTDKCLIKYYGFKMQGKSDITSDRNVMTSLLVGGKIFSSKQSHIILYIIWKDFQCWSLFNKIQWSKNHTEKKYFTFSLTLWHE